jgi:hypothetical protein
MTDSNQNENIEILDELNDWLVQKNEEGKYQFIYTQSPNRFSFELEEFDTIGESYIVFDSNESLSGMIEEAYKANKLTFRQVVLEMIKRNIQTHIKTLEIAAQIMRDI